MPMGPFNPHNALHHARSLHAAALRLQEMQRQLVVDRRPPPGSESTEEIRTFLESRSPQTLDDIYQSHGIGSGAIILQSLALEIILKVRLERNHLLTDSIRRNHIHLDLFQRLPDVEKTDAIRRYESSGVSNSDDTLEEALRLSSKCFVEWRYVYEYGTVSAYPDQMNRAFHIFNEGL